MESFEDRRKDFEKKFEYDQEVKFKTIARRNRLLGEWVATEIGIKDENGVKKKDLIQQKKESTSPEQLCGDAPSTSILLFAVYDHNA